eukprot:gene12411-26109_t
MSRMNPIQSYSAYVYAVFFWQGLGNLFPWNAFITASNYYTMRLCGTDLQHNFVVYFSNSYTILQIIGILFALRYQNMIPLNYRVLIPLCCYFIVFFLTSLLVLSEINPYLFFGLTLLSTGISGFCSSMLSSGLFGLASMLPGVYTAGIMSGQALAGVSVSLLGIISIVSNAAPDICHPEKADDRNAFEPQICNFIVDRSALGYFATATVVLFSCIFAFLSILPMPEIRKAIHKEMLRSSSSDALLINRLLQAEEMDLSSSIQNNTNQHNKNYQNPPKMILESLTPTDSIETDDEFYAISIHDILRVTKMVIIPGLAVCLSMMLGPTLVRKKDASLAGTIMLVFLTFGIVCGSCVSFLAIFITTGRV